MTVPDDRPAAGDRRYDEVIGEPVVVPEPLIAAGQAAAVMGVSTQRVNLLARAGILPVHLGHRERRYRLKDAEDLASPITLHEAAEILGRPVAEVRSLVAKGTFTDTGESLRPVRRWEIEWQRLLKRPTWTRRPPKLPGDDGMVNISSAASVLQLPEPVVRELAKAGRIPATLTEKGWRFRPDLLELTGRARRTAEQWDRLEGEESTAQPSRAATKDLTATELRPDR